MIAEHVPSVLDYGLYGLLAVLVIRELFSLIRFAFSHRKNGGNPGNHAMNASELRGHLEGLSVDLRAIRDGQIVIQTKQGQILSGMNTLLAKRN